MAQDLIDIIDSFTPDDWRVFVEELARRCPAPTPEELMADMRLSWRVGASIRPLPPVFTVSAS